MKNIAIFASGNGSNAEKIMEFFNQDASAKVRLVLSNKAEAQVLQRARNHGVATRVFDRAQFYQSEEVLHCLQQAQIDWIVLAGFMWLIPEYLTRDFPNRIVNIHPALLPKFGGKGMYGMHVHKAVIEAGETESGISIHLVNEHYDEGALLFQAVCTVDAGDTPELLAKKVHALEHMHYPRVIKSLIDETEN